MKQCLFALWLPCLSLFLFNAFQASAQNALHLSLRRVCSFDSALPSSGVDVGQSDPEAEDLIDAIRERSTGSKMFVSHFGAPLQTLAAVVGEDRRRYILYNPALFEPVAMGNDTLRALYLLMLAHALGHHFCEHPLDTFYTAENEWDADAFAGFALYYQGYDRAQLEPLLDLPAFASAIHHRQALLFGLEKAEVALLHSQGFDFVSKNRQRLENSLPDFNWPPPNSSADTELSLYFSGCQWFSGIDDKLKRALQNTGYHRRRYFQIPGGFALVTQMEQFSADGKPKNKNRWNPQAVRFEEFSISDYLKALFTTEPGYFRVLVFMATAQPIYSTAGHTISRETAQSWLQEGANILPEDVARNGTMGVKVWSWVYEFLVPESTRKPEFNAQSRLSGEEHLTQAGVMRELKK
jgi:hypothetical protein